MVRRCGARVEDGGHSVVGIDSYVDCARWRRPCFVDPRCPKARHLHPNDEGLSLGTPGTWGTRFSWGNDFSSPGTWATCRGRDRFLCGLCSLERCVLRPSQVPKSEASPPQRRRPVVGNPGHLGHPLSSIPGAQMRGTWGTLIVARGRGYRSSNSPVPNGEGPGAPTVLCVVRVL
jgi:hypothetical protein